MTLEFDLALEDLNESISINATNFYAYHNRGTAHAGRGQPEEAIENYTEAVRLSSITHIGLDPELYKTHFNLGLTYSHLGQYERAIEDFDEVIRLDPQDSDAYYWRGLAYENLGMSKEAELNFAKAKERGYEP